MSHVSGGGFSRSSLDALWARQGQGDDSHARIFVPNERLDSVPQVHSVRSSKLDDFFRMFPAIPSGRKPAVGFLLGFAFGPLVAVYLRNWFDFFLICAAIFFVVATLVAFDATAFAHFAPVLWGMWALLRIKHSRTRDAQAA